MKTYLLYITLIIAAYNAQAQTVLSAKDADAVKAKITATSKNIQSMQATFTQEKFMSVLSKKITSKGSFYFKKENLVRWEYTEPFKYIIVLSGAKVQIKDDKKVSEYDMSSNKSFKQINDMMIQLVQGNVLNSTQYKITYFDVQGQYMVQLVPIDKKLKSMFSSIQLYFDKTTYDVVSFKMIEVNADYTLVKFNNKKQNITVDASKFVLK